MSVSIVPLSVPVSAFNSEDNTQKIRRIYFTITPSGNYAAGGDILDWTQLGDILKSGIPPIWVEIQSAKSGGASGYIYNYTPGNPATLSNGKFQVLVQGAASPAAPLVDLGAQAYPAGVLADVIIGYADFIRL